MELSLFHSFLKCPDECPGQRGGSRRRELAKRRKLPGVLKMNFTPKAKFSSNENGIGILTFFEQKGGLPKMSGFYKFILEQLRNGVSKC